MAILNLCQHSFDVYNESQFIGLEQTNPTTLIAEGVEGDAILSLPSVGSIRIATSTVEGEIINSIPTVKTQYGEAVGIPNNVTNDDTLVVSLRTQSIAKAANHKLASQMASPYKVVRLRSNPSTVLGCMGLSFQ
jgi:hypothetical protein